MKKFFDISALVFWIIQLLLGVLSMVYDISINPVSYICAVTFAILYFCREIWG